MPSSEPTNDITINELILAYLPHAERHYRRSDGTATNELNDVKLSLRPLKALYGFTPAKDFKPLASGPSDRSHRAVGRRSQSFPGAPGKATGGHGLKHA